MTQNLTLTRQSSGANIRPAEGAGTTTLTDRDSRWQVFNLSAARTVVLPSDGAAGDVWQISNSGTGLLTLQSSNGNTITSFGIGGAIAAAALIAAPTTSANWAGAAVGFGNVSSTSAGLMPATLSNLDDVAATRMGLKQYRIGTAYNGGNTPAIAITVGTLNQSEGLLVPYQLQDGTWRLKFNFDISTTGTFAFNSITVGLSGITSGNIGVLNYLAISVASGSGGCYGSAGMSKNTTSTNNLIFITGVATVAGTWLFSGDVSLASKPTWAY